MAEIKEAMQEGGINRILLDNFSPAQLSEAIKMIGGTVQTEASGKITLENIRQYAETGVDYISTGALTHSYKSIDMSLRITEKPE